MLLLFLLEILLFFGIRFALLGARTHTGSDSCALLLATRAFREQRKREIRLPGLYLLEAPYSEYPPLFFYVLGWIPSELLEKYQWLVNYVFDFFVFVLLNLVLWGAQFPPEAILCANAIYALTPTLSTEYRALTPRSLSGALYVLFMLTAFMALSSPSALPILCVLFFLIFITHKLTLQLTIATCLYLACVHDWWFILVPPGGCLLAWLCMGPLFMTLVRMHITIVAFWHRNKYQLGAHGVHDSPVYGTPRQHKPPLRDLPSPRQALLHLAAFGAHNPFMVLLGGTLLAWGTLAPAPEEALRPLLNFFLEWAWFVLFWGVLTTDVPYFRSVGDGYKYVKYASFPLAALGYWMPWPLLVLGALASLYILWRNFHAQRGRGAQQPADLDSLLHWLREHPEVDRIGAVPIGLCDYFAQESGKHVLWGTHFSFPPEIIHVFPVLTKPLAELSRIHDVRYWILDTSYVSPEIFGLGAVTPAFQVGHYLIFARSQLPDNLVSQGNAHV